MSGDKKNSKKNRETIEKELSRLFLSRNLINTIQDFTLTINDKEVDRNKIYPV